MPEDEEGSVIQDKAMLERVATWGVYREVQTLLNDYGQTAFGKLVHRIVFCARIYPSEEKYLKLYYTKKQRSIIHPFRNTL